MVARLGDSVTLRDRCLYEVVQGQLGEGPMVDLGALPNPLNLDAKLIIKEFYKKSRFEISGNINRHEVIRRMLGDFNSIDSRTYYFATQELLKMSSVFWENMGDGWLDEEALTFILMSMYNCDLFPIKVLNNFCRGNSSEEAKRGLREKFVRSFDLMQGMKNSTIDLTNYPFDRNMDNFRSTVMFMNHEQIKTLLRRLDFDQIDVNRIYYAVFLNDNNRELLPELLADEEMCHPDLEGIGYIFEKAVKLAKLGKLNVISYLFNALPIELQPNDYETHNEVYDILKQVVRNNDTNNLRYFLEEAPEGLKFEPNDDELFELLRVAALDNNITNLRYLLEQAPVAFRFKSTQVKKRKINNLLEEVGNRNVVRVAKYLMEEAPEDLRPDRETVLGICSQPINSEVNNYLWTRLSYQEKWQVYPNFPLACASGRVVVVKHFLEDVPVGLMPDRATILHICSQPIDSQVFNYLWAQLSFRERMELYIDSALREINPIVNSVLDAAKLTFNSWRGLVGEAWKGLEQVVGA